MPTIARALERNAEAPADSDGLAAIMQRLQNPRKASLPFDPGVVVPPSVTDGTALSTEAVTGLLNRLRREGPDSVSRIPRRLRPWLDDESAHAFGESVYRAWREEADPDHKWCIYQLSLFGSDALFDSVGPGLDRLASVGRHHESKWWLDTLARHTGDRAHSWLFHWARHAERRSVREAANTLLDELLEAREETLDELVERADRFVLAEVLDGRVLAQSADELDGRTRADAVGRLEDAMVAGRTWSGAAFRAQFLENVFYAQAASGLLFRVSGEAFAALDPETSTLVDDQGDPVDLPDDATVGIVHPLDLDDEVVSRWGPFFAELDVVQPFPQLDRPTFARSHDPQLDAVPAQRLRSELQRRNWRHEPPRDAGNIYGHRRTFAGRGLIATVSHDAINIASPATSGTVELRSLQFAHFDGRRASRRSVDPVVYSEAVRDLEALVYTSNRE